MPRQKLHCPNCDAPNPVPIVYGMPGPELAKKAEEGRVVLGGCCVTGEDPQWRCRKCGYEWRREEGKA